MTEAERLREAVWSSRWSRLRDPVESLALDRGESIYVVGGVVRDLLIDRQPADLDLVVEGDGGGFAAQLAARLGLTLRSSERFLTAEIALDDGGRLDVSTARSERYPAPGALPRVEPASLLEDLSRRDFTINTFALWLAGPSLANPSMAGTVPVDATPDDLLSHPDAAADLRGRLVRVLHERSFVDDPTRLLRAVDLEIGIDGRLEATTEALARDAVAVGALGTVSGQRLWAVIEPALDSPASVVDRLGRWQDLGLFEELFPGAASYEESLTLVESALGLLTRLSAAAEGVTPGMGLATVLLALAHGSSPDSVMRWVERFALSRSLRRMLLDAGTRLEEPLRILGREAWRPSSDHAALDGLSLAELALLGALAPPGAVPRLARELSTSRRTDLAITSRDLLDHGVTPGPALGRALERTLAARLDGDVDAAGELDFALRQFRSDRRR